MKTRISLLLILFSLIITPGFSQDKKEASKEDQKLEKQKQIEAMVNAKEFVFVARIANPSGGKSRSLTSSPNFMKFSADMIDSDMPYFGKVTNTSGYGTDAGLKFKGKPETFTIKKGKNDYDITVIVKGETDRYKIYLTVGFEGSTMVSVVSNNRSPISFTGDVSAPQKAEEKK
jgi:hypothetical protein